MIDPWSERHLCRRLGSQESNEQRTNTMAKPHTGQKAPQSGIYKPGNGAKEIAGGKGDTLPPAKGKGTDYTLVRPTK